jgi:hypothetical protein
METSQNKKYAYVIACSLPLRRFLFAHLSAGLVTKMVVHLGLR